MLLLFFKSSSEDILHCFERKGKGERGWRGGRGKGRRETSIGCLLNALTGDQIHNLGMCPDQEMNPQPSSLQDNAQLSHTGQGKIKVIFKVNCV